MVLYLIFDFPRRGLVATGPYGPSISEKNLDTTLYKHYTYV